MTKLASYYVPGLYVEDFSIDVPLDWRGLEPATLAVGIGVRHGAFPDPIPGAPESIKLFYRTLCAPEHAHDGLPLLVFLQGGPGGEGPRPTSPTADGWIAEAIKHFRVVLPDQRGTGRSSRVSGQTMARLAAACGADMSHGAGGAAAGTAMAADKDAASAVRDNAGTEAEAATLPAKGTPAATAARAQADFLKRFLARSIVYDFEYLRLTAFGGRPWTTLGQSYGGFLTLTYLSLFPEGVAASFTCGGIPHVPASAAEVYAHTFPRMAAKTGQYYARYPEDAMRVAAVADRVAAGGVTLPDGSPLTVERLQLLGSDFGMKPSFERMHWLFDHAFEEGDGSVPTKDPAGLALSDGFLMSVLERTNTATNPLYWTLQEFIYADGMTKPIGWAAEHEKASRAAFGASERPLLFTGEACFPWMFTQMPELKPFEAAVSLLMEDDQFDRIYDQVRLAANEVPLQAAVYFDDMYVDSGLQLDTLSRVGASHAWVTNEFEHDGLHGDAVFKHLFEEALNRGDLERALRS